MAFRLSAAAHAAGFRVEGHDTVDSTNLIGLRRATEGDPGRLWIAALAQESGRGRRGRQWLSPRGNLAATVLTIAAEPRFAATLGFVAGLSLAQALQDITGGDRVAIAADGAGGAEGRFRLKWPNDVLASGAKLAGILLESAVLPGSSLAVAVGIGVNVVGHPEDLPYPATSLHALGYPVGAEDLFESLSDRWAANACVWNDGRGAQAIRTRWLDHAAGLGGEAAIRLDGRVLRGTFETIDEDCRFVLRLADGSVQRITAGDVHFGVVASAGAA